MNDAVTGGGFAAIGTVIRCDLDLAAQLKPGDRIKFKRVGIEQALDVRREKLNNLSEIKRILKYPFN